MTDLVALRGFVDALVRAGVGDAVVCPGSRSTPLALALRAHPRVTVRVLVDERSAGFFALGMARAGRRPVAVLTTSGTAAANLLPAVVEASLGRVPLVLITADRPAELRDRGAAQAIDQVRLFGTHAKWFAELPLLDGEDVTARHVRSVATRAVATALGGPAGPVHLNVPFREPLVPDGPLGPLDGEQPTAVIGGRRTLADEEVERLALRLAAVERGLIVAGPQDDPAFPAAVARLAAALHWPILADPLSLVRNGPHDRARVIGRGDQLLRPGPWRAGHVPGLVLRFGAMPTSKSVLTLLEEERPAQVVVDGDGGWREPAILPDDVRPRRFVRHGQRHRRRAGGGGAAAGRQPPPAGPGAGAPLARRLAHRRPLGRPRPARLADPDNRRRRGVRGRTVRPPRRPPARRRDPVGRQLDAGARHGRLAPRRTAGHPAAGEPRRERDRRRRLVGVRAAATGAPSPSSSATWPSSTTSRVSSRPVSTASPRRSSS